MIVVSLPGRVELYRSPVVLYFIFIVLALGVHWLTEHLSTKIMILYLCLIFFDQTRYLLTYFTHFTRTNPLVFSADAREIYDYLSAHRNYTYLVDRKFHGPIYAAFYWKLDPTYFQERVDWTSPDPWGWINAKSIGNVYSTEMTIKHSLSETG